MVLLFETQSTVATRANFCVLILEENKNKRKTVSIYRVIKAFELKYALFRAIYSSCKCYQINVDFGVTQSSSTSITGHHSGVNISHWLLSHQTDSKVLVHLDTNSVTLDWNLNKTLCG